MEHVKEESHATQSTPAVDRIVPFFQNTAVYAILVIVGVLPIIFLPIWYAPFAYTKTFAVLTVLLLAVIFYSLAVLRSGKAVWVNSPIVWTLWGVVLASVVSGLFSGDLSDSFVGDTLNVHSVFFMVLLAAVTTFIAVQAQIRGAIMRFYIALTVSGVFLALYHIVRIVFGPEALSFGIFTSATASPIGGWNDLGLFFGLTILLSIVALNILPLTKSGRGLFGTLVVLSLVVLTTINFFSVWLILAFTSMIVLMYSLARDRFTDAVAVTEESRSISLTSLTLTLATFVVAFAFVIAGPTLGKVVSSVTDISYVEVRPSPVATLDIARSVYSENFLLGVGPNKFTDAWRSYKDPTINETVFWNTNFTSGSGFIPTQLVTQGLLGMVAWVLFLAAILYAGFRFLMRADVRDTLWHFIGISSLVSVVYIWGMSLVYTPGVVVLILAAAFTGVFIAAYCRAFASGYVDFTVARNKRATFILVAVVMFAIVGSASTLYYAGRHYSSVWMFSEAVNNITEDVTIESVEEKIVSAFSVYQNDIYAEQLAQLQLTKINSLFAIAEPSPEQQTQFENSAVAGINAAQQAIALDPTEPRYRALLGRLYTTLALVGIEEADVRAREAFQSARSLDPTNPSYAFLEAQLELELGNIEAARENINQAIQQKPNFTNALTILAQIELTEGSVSEAIATTRSIISMEPNNPARYYQLGTLQLADDDIDGAVRSLEQAVGLDTSYANARYFLALAYLEQENQEAALQQLQVVQELNPDNQAITDLIDQVRSGEAVTVPETAPQDINDGESTVEETDDTVTTNESPDTNLIAPINSTSDADESNTSDESTESTNNEQPVEETTTN